jgi:SPX domain protein involved in polyphosphate accumulation
MKIPNSDRAIIEPSKLTEYLLNPEHKRGGAKAKLLRQFGYSLENWQQLESDIRKFHLVKDVNLITETAYGVRYVVIANLFTPVNRPLSVRTAWQIDKGTDFPRFITLVPN